ncbi:MAG: tryptophan 2,3-dioxygenase [Flavobacteriales bacterium]|nr:MAG: tryptophan 2,3-dioxygenase [Flavobacteriales bacterium]
MSDQEKTKFLIEQLAAKFAIDGQNVNDYLEGVLHANYEPYWRYIALDALLGLQQPKTDIPDEMVFITYHQITELYFKLILHELNQIKAASIDIDRFVDKIIRIRRYLNNLIASFDIMIDGMEKEQFLKFRMALLPASGFQSAQFRMIEMAFTDMKNLAIQTTREGLASASLEEQYNAIYWKQGAMDTTTEKKTLTLTQFEENYQEQFLAWAKTWQTCNLYQIAKKMMANGILTDRLKSEFRLLDTCLNVNWRLSHYRSAVRYLSNGIGNADVRATGGTNWQKFLPPKFQKIVSFPELWTDTELAEWGKSWVDEQIG